MRDSSPKEAFVYDIRCPKTGYRLFRTSESRTVYTHALCSVKDGNCTITLHHSIYNAVKVSRTKKGCETFIIPITYTIKKIGSKIPKKRIKVPKKADEEMEALKKYMATTSSKLDGVAEGYNEASSGHTCKGIGNWK